MSDAVRLIRVFLAAPSDVKHELLAAKRVTAEWNQNAGHDAGATAELVHWTTHSYPTSGEASQEIINRQALDKCDILLGIFWTRFGTLQKTGRTGTETEIRRSLRAGRPVMLYFSDRPIPPSNTDQRQLRRIQQFKEEFAEKNLYWTYKSIPEFERLLRGHFAKALAAFVPARVRVAVGIVLKDDMVLMVRRRVPEGSLQWQFPAGFIKTPERGEQAIERHVLEETGIRCQVLEGIGNRIHPNTKMFIEYYSCTFIGGKARNLDTEENVDVRWVRCGDVDSHIPTDLFGPIQDLLRKHL